MLLVLLVSGAGKHRQARVFDEPGIAARELAEKKGRSPAGFDVQSVDTVGAKTCAFPSQRWLGCSLHNTRIAHTLTSQARLDHSSQLRSDSLTNRNPSGSGKLALWTIRLLSFLWIVGSASIACLFSESLGVSPYFVYSRAFAPYAHSARNRTKRKIKMRISHKLKKKKRTAPKHQATMPAWTFSRTR